MLFPSIHQATATTGSPHSVRQFGTTEAEQRPKGHIHKYMSEMSSGSALQKPAGAASRPKGCGQGASVMHRAPCIMQVRSSITATVGLWLKATTPHR